MVEDYIRDRALVFLKKNKDYGDSIVESLNRFGDVAMNVRILDKVNRFKQLKNNVAEVKDESINDTILDLFNYLMVFKAYSDGEKEVKFNKLVDCMYKEADLIITYKYNDSFIFKFLDGLDICVPVRVAIMETIKKDLEKI